MVEGDLFVAVASYEMCLHFLKGIFCSYWTILAWASLKSCKGYGVSLLKGQGDLEKPENSDFSAIFRTLLGQTSACYLSIFGLSSGELAELLGSERNDQWFKVQLAF